MVFHLGWIKADFLINNLDIYNYLLFIIEYNRFGWLYTGLEINFFSHKQNFASWIKVY